MTIRISQNIAISETGFLFNPSTGESFTINPVGAQFIAYLKEGLSDDEIINRMCEEYEVEPKDISRDFEDFKELLKQNNLVDDNE